VTLVWDPSPEPDIAGYTLVYGTRAGEYTSRIDVANQTEYTLTTLPDGTYYFAVQAYTYDGLTSGFSNEVVATLGTTAPPATTTPSPTAPSSCTTPDPFASLGGGTCHNGGWLAPGMPIPGGSSTLAVVPTAPAPAPSPTASAGSCSTSDPFVSMGGGSCYNGGWLPPGIPVPGTSSAPATTPVVPTPSAPVAPTGATSCASADPFQAMGGGTCYNGGWLPPGMAIPGGGSALPSPSPAPAPAGPSTAVGCQMPDPFVALGGGTCVSGGWRPPGMGTDDGQAALEVTGAGTLHVVSAADGLWLIEGDDGIVYTSPTEIPAELLVEGARVEFTGLVLSEDPVAGIVVVEILVIAVQP
jgi:hypothetical protein